MNKLLLAILFSASGYGAHAQSVVNPMTDTLRWNSSGFTDQIADTTVTKACQFITYGQNKIDWIQKNGKVIYALTVNSMSGTWTDINSDGSLTYNVTWNDLRGTIVVSRSGSYLIMVTLSSSLDKINNVYTITNFDIL